MDGYILFLVEYMDGIGFLKTRAPLYIDIIISILILSPLLSGLSIWFAIRKLLKLHQFTQFLLFFFMVITLGLFAYGIHFKEGFNLLLEKSAIDNLQAVIILFAHILISTTTVILWIFALIYAVSDKKRRALPGLYSESHARTGRRVFVGIILTAFSSLAIYWMLFMV